VIFGIGMIFMKRTEKERERERERERTRENNIKD
jgi:hypothetical protein